MAKNITLANLSRFKTKLDAQIAAELEKYYLKTETYNKTEVDDLIAAIKGFTYEVVTELPTASAETMRKIYLVPAAEAKTQDYYNEFITIDKGETEEPRYVWEKLGDTRIDLSNYYTKEETDDKIEEAVALKLDDVTVDGVSVVATVEGKKVAQFETATDAEIDALFA